MEHQRWTPYTTVAAIIEQNGRYLLVKENTRDGIRLNNPAGHLELGESLAQACAREVLEESAYQFTPTSVVGIYLHRFLSSHQGDMTYLRVAFGGEIGAHFADRALDDGIIEAVWMSYDEIKACTPMHRTPLLLQCIEDHRLGRHYPLDLLTTNQNVWEFTGQAAPAQGDTAL